ncbi:forkhead-associated domain-containing protein 1 isoform X2 [Onychostoma macrolepis]|uniref:forkhead-associated domain-containing protein 1 isoform X2 n=1 Tax=Onychostoma macrolepis TaxID=369639 RepID=UPI00272AB552|nr:forkhead-associated domain-containing protein 1 isoform X2 [Onychostoma macrolepis]
MRGFLKTLNWVFKLQPKSTTVGRHKDSDLCLQNSGVDECHATIDWCEADGCYVICDLNSAHGTYVNDCRIHNATVRLSPGDQLHFGYGGSTYELCIDSEKSFPLLAAQSPIPQAWVRARTPSVSPHPPTRPRPMSAGSKRGPNAPDRKTQSYRPGSWSGNTGRACYLRNKTQPNNSQSIHVLPVEEEERLHRLGDGHLRVSVCFEDESQRKDDAIVALKEEVSALRLQLSQKKQGDPDVTHRLRCLENDIKEKKDQIQQLKEQMLELQRCSGEMLGQAVTERDQKISNLLEQMDKLRNEKNSSAALVGSLKKDVSAREKQALKLAAEVDKLRQDVRHKDAKLTSMVDKLKDTQKHQNELLARQSEVESLKKEQASLLTETDRLKQLHQQTQQKEQRVQEELKHTQSRFDSFRDRIVKTVHVSDKESDQKVLDCLTEVMEQMEMYKTKVHNFEMKLKTEAHTQREMLDETQTFRARLQECQRRVQDACIADKVLMEISGLQDMKLSPALSWIQEHSLSILNLLYRVLQNAAQSLQTAGVDVSLKTGGLSGALQILCQDHMDVQSELRKLKSEREKVQETVIQSRDLHSRLEFMQKQFELEKLQAAEGQREMKNTLTRQLEEVMADLQSVRQTESALRREIETRKTEWQTKMEEAKIREAELKETLRELHLKEDERSEKMKQCEEREAKALQRGAEEERKKHRVEVEEYREQVRQHAYTIVAMETRINKAQQSEERWKEMEEERDSLKKQLKEALVRLEGFESNSTSYTSEKQQEPDETLTSLRASLVSSQQEVASQSGIINALSRDLAQVHARLSDMTGELSEQQKLELESHKALVVDQKIQLSMLTQKLTMMSQLVQQKDEETKKLGEKLRQTEEDLKSKAAVYREMENTSLVPLQISRNTKDVALMTAPNDVINQGSKHKGHRRDEAILQQQEGLRDMRERIRALEQKWPSKRLSQQGEPEKQGQMKTQRLQRSAARRESSGFAFPEALTEAARERTARLDMSDALELSERTYLKLARVLHEALELSDGELSGCASLKHLPPDERQHIVSMRQTDLEFVRTRLDLQNRQSQQQELLLQENQREIHKLRESQVLGFQMQAEFESVKAELETQRQETEQLQQALQDSINQLQRNQQERSVTNRNNRSLSTERTDRKSGRVGHHNCIPNESYEKTPAVKKRTSQMRLKRRESDLDNLKKEMGQKQQICSMVSDLANPLQAPESSQHPLLTEAH